MPERRVRSVYLTVGDSGGKGIRKWGIEWDRGEWGTDLRLITTNSVRTWSLRPKKDADRA